jgi:hypothetical protein
MIRSAMMDPIVLPADFFACEISRVLRASPVNGLLPSIKIRCGLQSFRMDDWDAVWDRLTNDRHKAISRKSTSREYISSSRRHAC